MFNLYFGDCLNVLKGLEAESVDMVFADLPYGTTACKWDSIIEFEPFWDQIHRITKKKTLVWLLQPVSHLLLSLLIATLKTLGMSLFGKKIKEVTLYWLIKCL